MNTHADNQNEHGARAAAHSTSQQNAKSEAPFQFADLRPETIAQRKMQASIQNSTRVLQQQIRPQLAESHSVSGLQPLQKASAEKQASHTAWPVVQRALVGTINSQSKSKYDVTYTGKKSDFKDGEEPGGSGITGVTGYSGAVAVEDSVNGGDGYYRDSVTVNASDREYHRGHILANGLGGTGAADNIFLQDGGQNTTGKWPSFERQAASYRGAGSQGKSMTYRVVLTGTNLKYDQGL